MCCARILRAKLKDTPMKNIVHTAIDAGKFTTFLGALKAAALVDELRATGPFTVFAPTDDAFRRLPGGMIDALMNDIPKLKAILTLHVIPDAVALKDLQAGGIQTIEGATLDVAMRANDVFVNDAKIVHPDIAATNGVIHAINMVMMPKKPALGAAA
jgi:uncharacterized surface protein with fasciclin (FAS1) repeats